VKNAKCKMKNEERKGMDYFSLTISHFALAL
jgi:hypothetical protein